MAPDNCIPHPRAFGGFGLSLNVPDTATGDRLFTAPCTRGQVMMPLTETSWSPADLPSWATGRGPGETRAKVRILAHTVFTSRKA